MSEWKFESLENVAKIKGRIGWKGYKTSDLRDSGPIVFSGTEIKSNSFIDFSKVKHLTEEKFEESPEIMLRDKDIMVATRGSLGQIGFYRSEYGPATINPSLVIVSEFKGIPEYLFYYFISKIGQENILAQSSGTTIPAIYQADLKKIIIPLPPLPTQKAIAEILSSLDDKIELNNQINQNLEALAQALFKQWFVDFEFPNENGEPYKSSGGEMIDSELGEIPKGWVVSSLSTEVLISSSKRIFSQEYVESGIPFFRGKEITELDKSNKVSTELFISSERYREIKSKFGTPKIGDILITSVGTIGNTFLIDKNFDFYFKDGNITWIKEYTGHLTPSFIFTWLRSKRTQAKIKEVCIGSTQQALTITALDNLRIISPPKNFVDTMNDLFSSIYRSISSNKDETYELEQLRDTLLPKLISGELEVNESLLEPTF